MNPRPGGENNALPLVSGPLRGRWRDAPSLREVERFGGGSSHTGAPRWSDSGSAHRIALPIVSGRLAAPIRGRIRGHLIAYGGRLMAVLWRAGIGRVGPMGAISEVEGLTSIIEPKSKIL